MKAFITKDTPVTDEVLNTIAHLPTKSLSKIVEDGFFKKLTDRDFMRIGVLLAEKGYDEGGCPIGGVIISNETRQILGKGITHWCRRTILIIMGKPRRRGMRDGWISARPRCLHHSARAISARH